MSVMLTVARTTTATVITTRLQSKNTAALRARCRTERRSTDGGPHRTMRLHTHLLIAFIALHTSTGFIFFPGPIIYPKTTTTTTTMAPPKKSHHYPPKRHHYPTSKWSPYETDEIYYGEEPPESTEEMETEPPTTTTTPKPTTTTTKKPKHSYHHYYGPSFPRPPPIYYPRPYGRPPRPPPFILRKPPHGYAPPPEELDEPPRSRPPSGPPSRKPPSTPSGPSPPKSSNDPPKTSNISYHPRFPGHEMPSSPFSPPSTYKTGGGSSYENRGQPYPDHFQVPGLRNPQSSKGPPRQPPVYRSPASRPIMTPPMSSEESDTPPPPPPRSAYSKSPHIVKNSPTPPSMSSEESDDTPPPLSFYKPPPQRTPPTTQLPPSPSFSQYSSYNNKAPMNSGPSSSETDGVESDTPPTRSMYKPHALTKTSSRGNNSPPTFYRPPPSRNYAPTPPPMLSVESDTPPPPTPPEIYIPPPPPRALISPLESRNLEESPMINKSHLARSNIVPYPSNINMLFPYQLYRPPVTTPSLSTTEKEVQTLKLNESSQTSTASSTTESTYIPPPLPTSLPYIKQNNSSSNIYLPPVKEQENIFSPSTKNASSRSDTFDPCPCLNSIPNPCPLDNRPVTSDLPPLPSRQDGPSRTHWNLRDSVHNPNLEPGGVRALDDATLSFIRELIANNTRTP